MNVHSASKICRILIFFFANEIFLINLVFQHSIMQRIFPTYHIVLVLLLLVTSSLAQDFDFSKFKPRTLSELKELNPGPAKASTEKKLAYLSGDPFYSQVRVKYIGTSRPISPTGREILKNWQTAHAIPAEIVNLFEKEFLFKECDTEYWLPVQQKVSTFFAKELKEGDMITIYAVLAGGLRTAGKMELLFLVNEFEK